MKSILIAKIEIVCKISKHLANENCNQSIEDTNLPFVIKGHNSIIKSGLPFMVPDLIYLHIYLTN